MRPDFSKIDYRLRPQKSDPVGPVEGSPVWKTAERIPVKARYTADDLYAMEHLEYAAGVAPFCAARTPTMYAMQPWTIRQYAGFSTAEESNAFYRRNLAAGPEGPVGGLRPRHASRLRFGQRARRRRRRQGRRGDRFRRGHEDPLRPASRSSRCRVSMTMNGAVLPIMAFYIVAAEEQGVRARRT